MWHWPVAQMRQEPLSPLNHQIPSGSSSVIHIASFFLWGNVLTDIVFFGEVFLPTIDSFTDWRPLGFRFYPSVWQTHHPKHFYCNLRNTIFGWACTFPSCSPIFLVDRPPTMECHDFNVAPNPPAFPEKKISTSWRTVLMAFVSHKFSQWPN